MCWSSEGEKFKNLVLGSAVSLTKVFPSGLGPFPGSSGAYMILSHLGVVTGPTYLEGNYPTLINLKIRFSLSTCCRQWGDRTRDTPSGSSTSLTPLINPPLEDPSIIRPLPCKVRNFWGKR